MMFKKFFSKKGGNVVGTNPFLNDEGYADPTVYHGIKAVTKEEKILDSKVSDLIHVFKVICSLAGFEIIGRVKFRHKKSGRMFE